MPISDISDDEIGDNHRQGEQSELLHSYQARQNNHDGQLEDELNDSDTNRQAKALIAARKVARPLTARLSPLSVGVCPDMVINLNSNAQAPAPEHSPNRPHCRANQHWSIRLRETSEILLRTMPGFQLSRIGYQMCPAQTISADNSYRSRQGRDSESNVQAEFYL